MQPKHVANAPDDDRVIACYDRAMDLLRASAHSEGFVASPAFEHYSGIWTRDAAITSLGANASGDAALTDASRRTIQTLARLQSRLGQIPNAYWPTKSYWDWGETGSTDSTAWFIVAAVNYYRSSSDEQFRRSILPHLKRALLWLEYQDANNFGLITSPEAGDWMDSSLNRSGKVLYVNVLYYWAICGMAEIVDDSAHYEERAESLRQRVQIFFWPRREEDYVRLLDHVGYPAKAVREFPHPASLEAYKRTIDSERSYFVSHGTFGRLVDRCDVLANLLVILAGLADADQTTRILDHLRECKASDPYPAKAWLSAEDGMDEPFELLKPRADLAQDQRWRNAPYRYHNGGIWPFIGGFYAATLALAKREHERQDVMTLLAEANRLTEAGDSGFHEWIDAQSGDPRGAEGQAWNAGTFVLACRATWNPSGALGRR